MLYSRMEMFVFQSPATHRCTAVIEFLSWINSCPLLVLSLFSSARKMTERAKTVVLCEHLSIVLSAISVFSPTMMIHKIAVSFATFTSIAAKLGMFRMFYPAKNTLDIRLMPYIYAVMLLYFAFPAIYVCGIAELISQPVELGLFAFNDVIIKIVYAVLLEFCDSKIFLLNNTDILALKKRETIEKAFVRFVHHEIRNPLACITSAIDELGESDAKQMYVRQLRTGMQSLERLLDDLKALIENSNGQAHLEEAIVNIPALLKNCTESIEAGNTSDAKIFTVVIDDSFPFVIGDEYRLSSLITSCAFSAYQKRNDLAPVKITLSHAKMGSMVDVHISFEYQANNFSDLQSEYELSAVKLRPETVRREHQLEYAFGLRLAESIADMYMGSVELRPGDERSERVINVHLQLLRSMKTLDTAVPKIRSIKRVLICDDNKIAARLVQRVCSNMNIDSDMVYDGKEAVDAVQAHLGEYFLLFMDIVMPNMSGVTATSKIHVLQPDLPIYGISGNAYSSDKEELVLSGARECFTKPISIELLQKTVSTVLEEER